MDEIKKKPGYAAIIVLTALAAATVVICTGFGPAGIPFFGLSGNTTVLIIYDIRLPGSLPQCSSAPGLPPPVS